MKFVTRKDASIEMFVARAHELGSRNCEIVFGRSVFCDIFNEPRVPENQIFRLRAAKPREIPKDFAEIFTTFSERKAFDALLTLCRDAFPERLANFRICLDEDLSGNAFLANDMGQKSAVRAIDYFRPKSAQTFRYRCNKLGFSGWWGSSPTLTPFYDYCCSGV